MHFVTNHLSKGYKQRQQVSYTEMSLDNSHASQWADTDRQTDRQADRQTDRQTGRQTLTSSQRTQRTMRKAQTYVCLKRKRLGILFSGYLAER